ncbi:DoxX family protein [Sorangium sp. So ce385]|uniref:DoxX family protein n=1 Tax=Sorangium sp. So ce385 TaxID=3133308 RepID=UPI003F5BDF48
MSSKAAVAGEGLGAPAWMKWAGWGMSGLTVVALLLSAGMKILQHASMLDMARRFGYREDALRVIGGVELLAAVLYAIPRTAPLGAILVTAHLGGAVANHVRVGEPFVSAVVIGILAWGGLVLRDARVRDLLPLSKP